MNKTSKKKLRIGYLGMELMFKTS